MHFLVIKIGYYSVIFKNAKKTNISSLTYSQYVVLHKYYINVQLHFICALIFGKLDVSENVFGHMVALLIPFPAKSSFDVYLTAVSGYKTFHKMSHIKFNLIAAASENMGIGKNNDLPWKLKYFLNYIF